MIRASTGVAVALALLATSPALAQGMQGMDMGGMKMPAPPEKPVAKPSSRATPAPATKAGARRAPRAPSVVKRAQATNRKGTSQAPAPATHAMMGMDNGPTGASGSPGTTPEMDMPNDAKAMPGMAMPAGSDATPPPAAAGDMVGMAKSGTALPAGNAPAPAPPTDHYAARIFPAAEIERSHRQMMDESGAQKLAFVMFNLAEYQPRRDGDGFRWEGEAWYGGDINRLTLKTEGEGMFRGGVEAAEIQAVFSRAVDPYFNLQAGVRQDLGRGARRTYATIGFEGLAPYMFEIEGAAFLSTKGEVLGRFGGYYDQRITQRLILQPRIELNLAAQDIPEDRIGAGVSNAELGLRLRYEITRQFAPYIGVSWDRKLGATADYARADGENVTNAGLVAGVRLWF